MKITACKTYLVEGLKYNWTLLKIETDAGIHGWGEATNWPGSPLIEAACQHVGNVIIGQDARRIDYLWTKLYRDLHWLGQAGPLLSAISAVDLALWDIKGKHLGARSSSTPTTGSPAAATRPTTTHARPRPPSPRASPR